MGETLEISRRTVKNATRPGQHVRKHGSFRHGINFLLNFVRKTPFELLTRRFHKAEWILWTPLIKKRDFSRLRLDFYAILWNRARFGGGASQPPLPHPPRRWGTVLTWQPPLPRQIVHPRERQLFWGITFPSSTNLWATHCFISAFLSFKGT